jgi:phage shock protein E
VRNPDEYAAGHIEGAQSIPLESGDFEAGVEDLILDDVYVVYCETGRRAEIAVERMMELGFTDVQNAGGIEDVADVVGPVVTDG